MNRIGSLFQPNEYGNGAGCHSDDSVTWDVLPIPFLADGTASHSLTGLSRGFQEKKEDVHMVLSPASLLQADDTETSWCPVTGSFYSKYIQRMIDTIKNQKQIPALHAHFTCINPIPVSSLPQSK